LTRVRCLRRIDAKIPYLLALMASDIDLDGIALDHADDAGALGVNAAGDAGDD
jgi:hypothetical protein